MIDYREYRQRVNRYLDERREPLDDPQVVAFLDAHPEHLQAFSEECADLEAVATVPVATMPVATMPVAKSIGTPTVQVPTKRRWLYAAAAAALFGLGWLAASGLAANEHTVRTANPDNQSYAESAARPSRILSATLHEVEPTLRPAAFYTVHDPLVRTATITLEAYEQRSELR